MGQHYLPQYYLRGFGVETDPTQIWAYEKQGNRRFITNVTKVANENRYWSEATEDWLSSNIEAPANTVIDKIRARARLAVEDKFTLSEYIVIMLKRVPVGRRQAEEWLSDKKNVDALYELMRVALINERMQNPAQMERIDKQLQDLDQARSQEPDTTMFQAVFEGSLRRPESVGAVEALESMQWAFLVSESAAAFIASDNPVYYFRDEGIGPYGAELSFPIDKRTALFAARRTDWEEEYLRATPALIKEINRRTAAVADRHLFFDSEQRWVMHLAARREVALRKFH